MTDQLKDKKVKTQKPKINETTSCTITKQINILGYTTASKGTQPNDRNLNKTVNMLPPSIVKGAEQF